mmetsp:Transcript_25692/g.66678  ORF Transcript_25692/g.66678 Transcript_25692/m.66678 type:complete len:246 (+) Transcript_25692:219-956(+)
MARNRRERPAAHAVAHADVGDCERRRVTRLRACGDATHCRQRKIIADLVRAHEVHDIFMICVEPEVFNGHDDQLREQCTKYMPDGIRWVPHRVYQMPLGIMRGLGEAARGGRGPHDSIVRRAPRLQEERDALRAVPQVDVVVRDDDGSGRQVGEAPRHQVVVVDAVFLRELNAQRPRAFDQRERGRAAAPVLFPPIPHDEDPPHDAPDRRHLVADLRNSSRVVALHQEDGVVVGRGFRRRTARGI